MSGLKNSTSTNDIGDVMNEPEKNLYWQLGQVCLSSTLALSK